MTFPISRRTFLRGLGTSIALPLLDSFSMNVAHGSQVIPKFIVIYKPNGETKNAWKAGVGAFPFVLEPFEALRKNLTIVSGLSHSSAKQFRLGDHGTRVGAFLTGAMGFPTRVEDLKTVISANRSIDFLIADKWKSKPIVIGPVDRKKESNRPNPAYYNELSWEGPRPAGRLRKPAELFNRIYGTSTTAPQENLARATQQAQIHNSILDYASAAIQRLKPKLGSQDREKMDEYLTSIREQELKIGQNESEIRACKADKAFSTTSDLFHKNTEIFLELMVNALACGHTNVITYVIDVESSGIIDDHHSWSHNTSPEGLKKFNTLNRAYNAQVAKFLAKMKSTQDSSGSLLDNSIVLYGSGIGESHNHEYSDLPILIAGGGAGRLNPGRVVSASTSLNSLLFTIGNKMGLGLQSFAGSNVNVSI